LLLRKYVEHAFCMWKQLAGTPVIFLIPQIQETLHNWIILLAPNV